MKVLSILQPWASLIILKHKGIETRSWDTKHRGPLLIHASAKKPTKEFLKMMEQWTVELGLPCYDPDDYPLGKILGQATLLNTVDSKYCFEGNQFTVNDVDFPITKQELAFGDYSPERFGWLLSDIQRFETPIPAKGNLGLWNYDLPMHQ